MSIANHPTNSSGIPRFKFGWLELAILAAAIALVVQFVPAASARIVRTLDFREWTHRAWLTTTLAALAVLIMLRYSSALRACTSRRVLIGAAFLVFVIVGQIIFFSSVPDAGALVSSVTSVGTWSRFAWIGIFVSLLAVLFLYRQGPEWRAAWIAHSRRVAKEKQRRREIEKRCGEKRRIEDIIIRGGRIDF